MCKIIYFILFVSILVKLTTAKNNSSVTDVRKSVKALEKYIKEKVLIARDVKDVSVYYSVKDNHTFTEMGPRPWITPGQSLRLPFIGDPCACSGYKCSCCAGIKIDQINFNRVVCSNFTYDPDVFVVYMDVLVNDSTVYHGEFSGSNPPPICIPVVVAGIPGIDICIRIFDIHMPGNNIHLCINFEARIATAPVLILQLDCVQMGQDGVVFLKPDNGTTTTSTTMSPQDEQVTQIDGDTYDEVTETKKDNTTTEVPVKLNITENIEPLPPSFHKTPIANPSMEDNNI